MLFLGKIFARLFNYLLYFLILKIFASDWVSVWIIGLSYYKICFGFSLFGLDILFYDSDNVSRQSIRAIHTIVVILVGVILIYFFWDWRWAVLSALSVSMVRIHGVLFRRDHKLRAVLLEDLYPVSLLFVATILAFCFGFDFFSVAFCVSLVPVIFLLRYMLLSTYIPKLADFDWSILWISAVNALFVYLNYINREYLGQLADEAVINFQLLFQFFLVINILLQALLPNLLLRFGSKEFQPLLGFLAVASSLLTAILGIAICASLDFINGIFNTSLSKGMVIIYSVMATFSVLFYYEMFKSNVFKYARKLGVFMLISVVITYYILNSFVLPIWGYIVVQFLSIILPFVVSSYIYDSQQTIILLIFGIVTSTVLFMTDKTMASVLLLALPIIFVYNRWKLYQKCQAV